MNHRALGGTLMLSIALAVVAAAQEAPLTPAALQSALAARPTGAGAERLAARIRDLFGRENLPKGPAPKVDGLTVAWALEASAPPAPPKVVAENGRFVLPLARVGSTDLYAGAASLPDGTAMRWDYQIGDKHLGGGQLEVYSVHPDSVERPDVPRGKVTQMPTWRSKIFPDTERDWWIYVPAQYSPDKPACVMVFQDGAGPRSDVPTVFDNLIAKGEMPVTVGIFIQPGNVIQDGKVVRSNRSFEYDTLYDQYARFLLEEILPEVEKTVKLRQDGASRAISGASSGGICAFTVAWERPEQFSKVLSWVGSFTNIASGSSRREGGHNYAALIRKTPRKPIRVFLQDGANDLDNVHGNWPLANQEIYRALQFARYDVKFAYGSGFHSGRHGQAILPDSLRWLWRPE